MALTAPAASSPEIHRGIGSTVHYTELVLQPEENSARKAPKEDNTIESKETFFNVYPNPTTDYFTLEYQIDASVYSVLQMEIYDATGRKIILSELFIP